YATTRWRPAAWASPCPCSYAPCPRAREETARPDHQNRHEDRERRQRDDRRPHVARHVAEREAEDQPADERADRAVEPAQDRGGEAEDRDRVEVVRAHEHLRADQEAGERAGQRRQRPAERE